MRPRRFSNVHLNFVSNSKKTAPNCTGVIHLELCTVRIVAECSEKRDTWKAYSTEFDKGTFPRDGQPALVAAQSQTER